jgi:hypothetical protein
MKEDICIVRSNRIPHPVKIKKIGLKTGRISEYGYNNGYYRLNGYGNSSLANDLNLIGKSFAGNVITVFTYIYNFNKPSVHRKYEFRLYENN